MNYAIAIAIVIAALIYEIVAIVSKKLPTWSQILFAISENKFALVLLSWFIGFVMGHALAPI